MNSNERSQLVLVAVVTALLLSQLLGYQRMGGMERQMVKLRAELSSERRAPVQAPKPQVVVQQPAPKAAVVASLPAVPAPQPKPQQEAQPVTMPAPAQELPVQVEEPASHVSSLGQLELTEAPAASATAPEPMRLVRAPQTYDDLQEMSEDELNVVVAGELGPGPGMAAAAAIPTATFPTGAPAEPDPSESQRLAPRVEKGGVLLRKGRTQVEPTVSYSHISKNRIGLSGLSIYDVIFIGEIRAEEVERDLFTSSLGIRHGITNNLQVDVELPAQLQREDTFAGPIEERNQSTQYYKGFNDISAGLFYQFMKETQTRPGMIAHTRIKAPFGEAPRFGSGIWAVKTGLVMVKSSDPVALFSNLAYTYTLPGVVNRVDINPGNSFEYNVGMAYALNYNLSANMSFEQIFVTQALSNGSPVPGSRLVLANFKTGATYAINKSLSIDFSVGTGLTENSPDVTVSLSFPYTF